MVTDSLYGNCTVLINTNTALNTFLQNILFYAISDHQITAEAGPLVAKFS